MKRITVLCVALLGILTGLNAQCTITLLNGKTISAADFRYDSVLNLLEYEGMKGGQQKLRLLDGSEVFSVSNVSNVETVIYKPQHAEQFSTFEMRYVVQGESAAYKDYKPVWPFLAGFAVGYGSMLMPVNPMLGLCLPIAYNVGISFAKPCNVYVLKHYPTQASDELFVYGYKQHGKTKILKRSIFGSVAGIAAGLGTLFVMSRVN